MKGALLRRAGGDVLVGVGSVLELGARARVNFSRIGYAPYHSKKKKKAAHPKSGSRADPIMLLPQIPTLGWTALKISGARARGKYLIFSYTLMPYHTIARRKKSGLRQIGCARRPPPIDHRPLPLEDRNQSDVWSQLHRSQAN